jgi:tetratricopeptide (TPR) repeat protein/transcriptional regulator with XRE-family HTH domain
MARYMGDRDRQDEVDFTTALRAFRMRARLTQEGLADRAGLSARSVRDIERGKVQAPRSETVRLLGIALGLADDELEAFVQRARDGYWANRQEPPPPPRVETAGHRPAQLPADIAGFVGRQRHLDELDQLLQGERGTAVPICALSGGAGVGKTTLSVHWAHRVAPRFPDGQLYVNLRGFDRRDGALDPLEVVRGFLDALGVLPAQVPDAAQRLVGLYRSVLSDRRLLILLDNARNAEQVRPLLPGAPGCVVVVNSRDRLTGLVAIECAHPLTVELLSDAEALELLSRRIGRKRLAAEPLAAQEIVDRCAGLPVVLSIVAARVATQPGYPLAAVSHHAGGVHSGLDGLDDGDAGADIRAAFASSYRTLSEPAARMFRLLGLHPGPAMSAAAAASLAGEPLGSARLRMAELTRLHLVNTSVPDEYTMHDLLRAYAAELADECDGKADRCAAVRRLLDHYLHTAHDAALQLETGREPLELVPAHAAVTTVAMTMPERVEAWFSTERPTLVAAVRLAHDCALWTHAWQLAWVLAAFCERRGHWRDQWNTQQIALDAARRSADPVGLAHAHRGLARVRYRTGHYDDALAHLLHALELHTALDDTIGLARVHFGLGTLYICLSQYEEALHHNRLALDLFREAGSRSGEAEALNGIGWSHARNGQYEQAVELGEQAVELCQALGITSDEACTWDTLGYAHQHLGHHADAARCYERAVRLYQATGERHLEAETLEHLGAGRLAAGDTQWAHRAWSDALAILDELRHPDAGQLRLRIAGLS